MKRKHFVNNFLRLHIFEKFRFHLHNCDISNSKFFSFETSQSLRHCLHEKNEIFDFFVIELNEFFCDFAKFALLESSSNYSLKMLRFFEFDDA